MAITALVNLSDVNAGWGTIAYNGFTFLGLRDVKVSGEEVFDRANRAVIFTRYTLRVHGFMVDSSESGHKTAMELARIALQEAGQQLTLTGQGIGDIVINGAGATERDVEWGPKPKLVEFTQIGAATTEYAWECTFSIKEWGSAQGNILAFNYGVEWNYGESGGCTRTISGYLQIAQTRTVGARTVATSADAFRNQIRVTVPVGMKRADRLFRLSEDRNTLDFTIVDVQLEGEAPPAGVLKAELDYEIENIPPGFARYAASLSGPIEVPVGTSTIVAAQTFMRIMLDKFTKLKSAVGTKGVVIPMRVRFGRTLGTRQTNFAFSWMVTGCLDDLLKDGGIWQPVSGATWEAWANSMRDSGAWGNYGTSNLVYNASEDIIVDLNMVGALPTIGGGGAAGNPASENGSSPFKVEGLTASNSWLAYENSVEARRDASSTWHHFSESYTPSVETAGNISTDTGVTMSQNGGSVNISISQHHGRPVDHVVMRGKGLRISTPDGKLKPAIPRLVSVGGKRVEEVKVRTDGPKAIACFFGSPIYVARWAILYRVVGGYLAEIPAQKNPALCCENSTA